MQFPQDNRRQDDDRHADGYEGVRQPISAEPIVEVKPAANASDDDTATAAIIVRATQTR